ncbi:hypothetical protein CCH79_00020236 [Gambusia affinis]|uniref:Uncharacterized protein n=1 Tax=Gambusia affinis TaxID=33528 RepID=A0A315W2Q8_GAMAF|nr:hypothetical protein CCH79_00020236 [Gambusia affinis]
MRIKQTGDRPAAALLSPNLPLDGVRGSFLSDSMQERNTEEPLDVCEEEVHGSDLTGCRVTPLVWSSARMVLISSSSVGKFSRFNSVSDDSVDLGSPDKQPKTRSSQKSSQKPTVSWWQDNENSSGALPRSGKSFGKSLRDSQPIQEADDTGCSGMGDTTGKTAHSGETPMTRNNFGLGVPSPGRRSPWPHSRARPGGGAR